MRIKVNRPTHMLITGPGKRLMEEGLDLNIPQAPGSLLITYKRLE
jgi:hypothetical protein